MESLISKIENLGISVIFPTEKGTYLHEGKKYDLPANTSVVILETVFNNNAGLVGLTCGDFKAVLLKGVYKDFVRILEGEPNISPQKMIKIAEAAVNAEKGLDTHLRLGIFSLEDETRFIFRAEEIPAPDKLRYDRLCYDVPSIMAGVEYSLSENSTSGSKTLYNRGMFNGYFPETLSTFSLSVAKTVPELFAPMMMSVNVKTDSPTFPCICGKPFINTANVDNICKTVGTTNDYYLLNYAPWLYVRNDKPSFKRPNLKVFSINTEEINEGIADIDSIKDIDKDFLLSDHFKEYIALCAMTMQLIQLKTWEHFTELFACLGDIELLLEFVYLTRKHSLIDEKLDMPPFIDPFYAPIKAEVKRNFRRSDFDSMYSALPFRKKVFSKKDNVRKMVDNLHECLDMRDKAMNTLFRAAGDIHKLLEGFGKDVVEARLVKNEDDIYAFELSDLRNFYENDYYGNIPITLWFKRWQGQRNAGQIVPYDIYEKDIANLGDVAERILSKKHTEAACLSFRHKDYEGIGHAPFHVGDKLSDIALIRNFSPVLLSSLDDCKAVVTDTAPIFSFLTEYCIRTDMPLYTGVRFAAHIANGKKLFLHKDKVEIKD